MEKSTVAKLTKHKLTHDVLESLKAFKGDIKDWARENDVCPRTAERWKEKDALGLYQNTSGELLASEMYSRIVNCASPIEARQWIGTYRKQLKSSIAVKQAFIQGCREMYNRDDGTFKAPLWNTLIEDVEDLEMEVIKNNAPELRGAFRGKDKKEYFIPVEEPVAPIVNNTDFDFVDDVKIGFGHIEEGDINLLTRAKDQLIRELYRIYEGDNKQIADALGVGVKTSRTMIREVKIKDRAKRATMIGGLL